MSEWICTPKEKEKEVEATTSNQQTPDPGYVPNTTAVVPNRWYCHDYEHRLDGCANAGFVNKPQAQHSPRGDGVWSQGARSPYARVPEARHEAISQMADDDLRVMTGEYLHGKNGGGSIFVRPGADEADVPKFEDDLTDGKADEVPYAVSAGLISKKAAAETLKPVEPIKLAGFAGTMNDEEPLEEGDWVLVQAQVTTLPEMNYQAVGVEVQTGGGKITVNVTREALVCITQEPAPFEPHHRHVLISRNPNFDGMVFVYAEEDEKGPAGWVGANFTTKFSMSWKTLWRDYGPFTEHYASRKLGDER
jgi:hypothetical protein